MSDLAGLLARHRDELQGWFAKHGGLVLRFETVDDLVQGLQLRALEREFRYEGDEAFRGWIYTVARTFLADRRGHWSALKRRPAALLRLTGAGGSDPGAAAEPAGHRTGPGTFASRREMLQIAVRALSVLRPRDRRLVRWTSEDVPIEEQAERLEISYTAARGARLRALERFRKAYALAANERR